MPPLVFGVGFPNRLVSLVRRAGTPGSPCPTVHVLPGFVNSCKGQFSGSAVEPSRIQTCKNISRRFVLKLTLRVVTVLSFACAATLTHSERAQAQKMDFAFGVSTVSAPGANSVSLSD